MHFSFVCQHYMLGALAEKFILHQCHDYHVVSFAESQKIRERNTNVESFSLPLRHHPASL